MALSVTINGIDRTAYVSRVVLERRLGEVGAGTLVLADRASTYVPSVWDPVVIQDGSTTLWRGQILDRQVEWLVPYRGRRITCRVADRMAVLDRTMLNTIYPAGTTLITILTDIVSLLDDDWPITLHPSQATGPTVGPITLAWVTVREALDALSAQTGWVYGIDLSDRLRMWAPGTIASGVTFSSAQRNVRVARWSQAVQREYTNAYWVSFGPSGVVERTDRFTGDGSTRSWTLRYAINQGDWPHTVYDSAEGAVKPVALDPDPSYEWTYAISTNTLKQRVSDPVLQAGQYVEATYTPGFPQTILVTNSTERAARGIWLRRLVLDSVVDRTEAESYASALLSRQIVTPKQITIRTAPLAIEPGHTVSVDLSALDISETMIIRSVSMTYDPRALGPLEAEIECIGSVTGSWLEYWRSLRDGGAGGGVVTGGGGVTTITGGLPVPLATDESASVVPGTSGSPVRHAVQVAIDAAKAPGGVVVVRCRIRRVSGSGTVTPQLRTVGGTVVGAGSPTSSSSFVSQTFSATLQSGLQLYVLAVVASDATTEAIAVGTVEV